MQADMEEGRHVFQEGNAFTLEAVQHKVLHHAPLESWKLHTVMLDQQPHDSSTARSMC